MSDSKKPVVAIPKQKVAKLPQKPKQAFVPKMSVMKKTGRGR
jgi:hypothetical protein